MNHHSSHSSGRPSRSLSGLLCGVVLCGTVIGLLTPDADASSSTLRELRLRELMHREAMWSQLFPESISISQSVIYLEDVLDDLTPWSHHLMVVHAQSAEFVALGGLHLTKESTPIAMTLDKWIPNEGPEKGPGTESGSSMADASLVSGVLIGDSGEQMAVVGVRLAITISELSLIVPVEVDVFVPLAFPTSSRHADKVVNIAQASLFGWDFGQEPEQEGELDPESESPGPQPSGSGPSGAGAGSQTPFPLPSECEASAWAVFIGTLAALWVEADIADGACFADCILDPASGMDGVSRVQTCLPGCGLGSLASGEGSITWAWSALSLETKFCEQPGTRPVRPSR